jgi:hypothetical protein
LLDPRESEWEVSIITRAVILSSLIITIISVARLLIVSNYQTPIAIAISYSNGTISTLTGTLVPLIPALLPLATQLLALFTLGAILYNSEIRLALFLATMTAFSATMFVAPAKISTHENSPSSAMVGTFGTWVLTLLLSVAVVGSLIRHRMKGKNFIIGSVFIVILVVTTVAVSTIASYSLPSPSEMRHIPDVLRRVWLPAELISTNNGSENVGYVLKTDGNWTTILWDSDRNIEIMRTSNITSRMICRIGKPDRLPLIFVESTKIPKIKPCETSPLEYAPIPPPRIRLP